MINTLQNVVLGLLTERPMHGYALKKAITPALPRDQLVNDGILYPLLKKLEANDLIEKRTEEQEGRPDRNVFHTTMAGKESFRTWLKRNEEETDEIDYDFFVGNPFLAKVLFFNELTEDEVVVKLSEQREAAQEKLDGFQMLRSNLIDKGVDTNRIAIVDLGIAQQREMVRWLDQLQKTSCKKK